MRQLLKITTTFALALVFSAGMAFGQSNTATVDQVGDSHSSAIQQDGDGNVTNLEQVDTDLNDGFTNSMTADVFQKFDNNVANIDQKGSDQQIGPGVSFATAEVDQVGNNNFLDLDQGPFFGTHEADIDMLGNNNRVLLRTSNGGGEANILFDGNQNELVRSNASGQLDKGAQVVQKNGSGRTQFIDVTVDGDANKIGADQQSGNGTDNLTIGIVGSDNFVPTYQGGKNGDIDITANGSDNFLKAIQTANDNTATVTLNATSDDNQVVVEQQTANNTATVTVDGLDNTSTVCQGSTCN